MSYTKILIVFFFFSPSYLGGDDEVSTIAIRL